jgi:redox-sensitive bicupin YhaK (pirin superfamily)
VTLPAGHWLDVELDPGHEHGFLCDTGSLAAGGAVAQPGEIVFQPAGAPAITLKASPSEPTRVLVLGGKPFGEQIVMWWNFIGRSHDEIARYRAAWQALIGAAPGEPSGTAGFGLPAGDPLPPIPAPPLPNATLRPRG